MKCKNCGTENPDDVVFCEKCGKPFYIKKYWIDWKAIIGGAIAGFILLTIIYLFLGKTDTFFFGVGPSLIFAGAIASFLAYNKNIDAGYDINQLLQGAAAGFIVGLVVIILMIADSSAGMLIIFLPSYTFWGFFGGCIGGIANLLRQKNKLLIIPLVIMIIIGAGTVVYLFNSIETDNHYDTQMSNVMCGLAFNNLLKIEADSYLSNVTTSNVNKISNLKEAQKRYQRMIEITNDALLWNEVALKVNSTPLRTEYSQAMQEYLNLKLKYYQEMESGIELSIKGDSAVAKTHYKNAKKLLPEIEKQKTVLNNIANKTPEFKAFIEQQRSESLAFAKMEQGKNELLTFPISPPENN